jgi:ATP-dependent helicase/nuclease subunit B
MAMVPQQHLEAALPFLEAGYPALTPNLRLARALRVDAARRLGVDKGVVKSPQVDALGAWIEQHWRCQVEEGVFPPARVLSAVEAEEVWLQIIEADLAEHQEFTLLQPRAAARAAQQCRDALLQYRVPMAAQQPRFQQDADCARFSVWLDRFEARLTGSGWTTIADLESQVAASARQVVDRALVLDSDTITPVTRAAICRLAGEVTWLNQKDTEADCVGIRYGGVLDEQRAAARWAAERYRGKAGSTAIVVLNLSEQRQSMEVALREAFDALDARYDALPVNFSRGIPFASAPIYRDALLALGMLEGTVSRSDLLAALRSPYLTALRSEDMKRSLAVIRGSFRLQADPMPVDELRAQLTRHGEFGLGRILDRIASDRLLKGKRSGREWRTLWIELLSAWGWPARAGVDSFEHQQIERFGDMLDQFEAAGDLLGNMSYRQALSLLRRILERRQFQPSTSADAIQILSEREVRGLHFDAVWVVGAQSTHLPQRVDLLPFIPAVIQREFRMPASVDPEGLASGRALLAGLQQHCNHVVVSWHHMLDGVEQLPSPLLSAVSEAPDEIPSTADRWRMSTASPAVMESLEDIDAGALDHAGGVTGGVALLRDQSQCPFRAWVTHRLGVRALKDPATGLTAGERGDLLHTTLEHFWLACGDSRTLRGLSDEALANSIDQAVSAAIRGLKPAVRRRVGAACLDIESQRLKQRVAAWLNFERERQIDFKVVARESKQPLSVGELTLEVVVDRIDELADGRKLVLDYKSSDRFSARDWWGERIREPQLPGYALLDDAIAGVAWAVVSVKGMKALSLGEDLGLGNGASLGRQLGDEEVTEWTEVREAWRQQLNEIADEFVAGKAEISPMKRACDFCSLQAVCRIEYTAMDEEEELTS